ncbi:MAG: hypothetical protein ACI4NM_04210 [Bullifex sp.]
MKDYLVINPALEALACEHCLALHVGKGQERFVSSFISSHGACVRKVKGLDREVMPLALEYPPHGSSVSDFELFFDSPFAASRLAAFEGLFFIDLSAYAGTENAGELRMLKDYIASEHDITFVLAVTEAERSASVNVFEAVAKVPCMELVCVDTESLKNDLREKKGFLTESDEALIDTLSDMIAEKSAIESIVSAVMGDCVKDREASR